MADLRKWTKEQQIRNCIMHRECAFWSSPRSKIPQRGLESISLLLVPENVSEKPAKKKKKRPGKFSFRITFTPKDISQVFSIAPGRISSSPLICQKIPLSNDTQDEEKTGERETPKGKGEWVSILEE